MRKLSDFARDEHGAILAYILVIMVALLGVAGFGIDAAYATYIKSRLQNASDASSLAGAARIPVNSGTITDGERTVIIDEAQDFARKNMTTDQHGTILTTSDVTVGYWDAEGTYGDRRTFYPEGSIPAGAIINAVQTVTRRSSENNNSLPTVLIRVLGFQSVDVVAESVSVAPPPSGQSCINAGFLALGTAEGGSENEFYDGWCLHGEKGVKMSSQNCLEGGPTAENPVVVSMPDKSRNYGQGGYDFGSDNEVVNPSDCVNGTWENNDLPDFSQEATFDDYIDPSVPFIFDTSIPGDSQAHVNAVNALIETFISAGASAFPSGLSYVFSNSEIKIDNDRSNTVFISRDKVSVGSDVNLENVFLISKVNVEIGSNVTLGRNNFCAAPGADMNFILGAEQIKIGSDVGITATQAIAGNYVDFGSDNVTVGAVSFISGGGIKFGSQWKTFGCGGANLFLDFNGGGDRELIIVN